MSHLYKLKFAPNLKSKKTVLKYSPFVQASSIKDESNKIQLNSENINKIKVVVYDELASHYKLTLETPINNRKVWYAFNQHIDVIQTNEKSVLPEKVNLLVPYFSQRDNKTRPHQTCNMTSASMVIEYLRPGTADKYKPKQLEDVLTAQCVRRYGFSGIYYHANIVKMLSLYGVKSVFSTTTPFTKVKEHLAEGNPVIYSGRFTRSGHIIVIKGYDEKGFFVNDPWGEWFSDGYWRKFTGENQHYSYNLISNVSYGGQNAGWCHLCKLK